MTCIEKLREMHPELDDTQVLVKILASCPSDITEEGAPEKCPKTSKGLGKFAISKYCRECWEREIVESIPHEFEYLSKCMIYDRDSDREMRNERVWVTVLDRMYKHHYTGKPYYRIRTESESGGVWEGWVTEEDIRGILKGRVPKHETG